MNKFGVTIKKKLIDLQMTQTQLADKMQVNTRALCALLNRDNISLDKMESIADALNCDLVIELKPRNEEKV